jgi:hypothetical protein
MLQQKSMLLWKALGGCDGVLLHHDHATPDAPNYVAHPAHDTHSSTLCWRSHVYSIHLHCACTAGRDCDGCHQPVNSARTLQTMAHTLPTDSSTLCCGLCMHCRA